MQDDNTNTNVEEVVADEPQEAPLEQTEPDQEQGVPQESEESVEEEAEAPQEPETVAEEAKEEPAPPSRRETLRIQNLLKKYGPPPERPAPSQQGLNYQETLDADPEVIQQLEADRKNTGQAQYNEGLKRAEYLNWNTTLKIDAPNVERKYPVLDPSSPEFHPAAADAINQWYLNMSGFDNETKTVNNPDIGYADFVEGFMELVQETAGQKNAQTVKNVAKQAASTGLRPDGSAAKRMDLTKEPQKMSMEELYAAIGQKPPKG